SIFNPNVPQYSWLGAYYTNSYGDLLGIVEILGGSGTSGDPTQVGAIRPGGSRGLERRKLLQPHIDCDVQPISQGGGRLALVVWPDFHLPRRNARQLGGGIRSQNDRNSWSHRLWSSGSRSRLELRLRH